MHFSQIEEGQETWACRCLLSASCPLCLWHNPCHVKLTVCSSESSPCHSVGHGDGRGLIQQLQKIQNPLSSPIFLQKKSVGLKDMNLLMEHISTLPRTFWTQNKIAAQLFTVKIHSSLQKLHAWVLAVKPSPLRSTGPDSRHRSRQVNTIAELEPQYHTAIYDIPRKHQNMNPT